MYLLTCIARIPGHKQGGEDIIKTNIFVFFCIFLCYRVKLVRDFSNFVSDILPLNSPFWQFAWFALFWFQIAVSKRTVTPFVDIKFPRYFEFSDFSILLSSLLIPDFFVNIYYAPPSRPEGPRRCPDRGNAGGALVFPPQLLWLLYALGLYT